VIKTETKSVDTSVYDRTSVTVSQVRAADSKDVVLQVDSENDKNRVSLSKAAVNELSTNADSLTVVCSGQTILFDDADLQKLAKAKSTVYLYVTGTKVTAKYKDSDGKMVTIKDVGDPQGVVEVTGKKVSGSSYYQTKLTSPKVKTAYSEVADTSQTVTVSIDSKSTKNQINLTAAGAKRLAKYADGLHLICGTTSIDLTSAELKKLAKSGTDVVLYLNGSTLKAVYRTTSGTNKTILKKSV
jgi:hypothetical protein